MSQIFHLLRKKTASLITAVLTQQYYMNVPQLAEDSANAISPKASIAIAEKVPQVLLKIC